MPPRDWMVAMRPERTASFVFGRADGLHERKPAFVVEVDADAEVDLRVAGIVLVEFNEAENGIVRTGFKGSKVFASHFVWSPC